MLMRENVGLKNSSFKSNISAKNPSIRLCSVKVEKLTERKIQELSKKDTVGSNLQEDIKLKCKPVSFKQCLSKKVGNQSTDVASEIDSRSSSDKYSEYIRNLKSCCITETSFVCASDRVLVENNVNILNESDTDDSDSEITNDFLESSYVSDKDEIENYSAKKLKMKQVVVKSQHKFSEVKHKSPPYKSRQSRHPSTLNGFNTNTSVLNPSTVSMPLRKEAVKPCSVVLSKLNLSSVGDERHLHHQNMPRKYIEEWLNNVKPLFDISDDPESLDIFSDFSESDNYNKYEWPRDEHLRSNEAQFRNKCAKSKPVKRKLSFECSQNSVISDSSCSTLLNSKTKFNGKRIRNNKLLNKKNKYFDTSSNSSKVDVSYDASSLNSYDSSRCTSRHVLKPLTVLVHRLNIPDLSISKARHDSQDMVQFALNDSEQETDNTSSFVSVDGSLCSYTSKNHIAENTAAVELQGNVCDKFNSNHIGDIADHTQVVSEFVDENKFEIELNEDKFKEKYDAEKNKSSNKLLNGDSKCCDILNNSGVSSVKFCDSSGCTLKYVLKPLVVLIRRLDIPDLYVNKPHHDSCDIEQNVKNTESFVSSEGSFCLDTYSEDDIAENTATFEFQKDIDDKFKSNDARVIAEQSDGASCVALNTYSQRSYSSDSSSVEIINDLNTDSKMIDLELSLDSKAKCAEYLRANKLGQKQIEVTVGDQYTSENIQSNERLNGKSKHFDILNNSDVSALNLCDSLKCTSKHILKPFNIQVQRLDIAPDLCVSKAQHDSQDIEQEMENLDNTDSFISIGGSLCSDSSSETVIAKNTGVVEGNACDKFSSNEKGDMVKHSNGALGSVFNPCCKRRFSSDSIASTITSGTEINANFSADSKKTDWEACLGLRAECATVLDKSEFEDNVRDTQSLNKMECNKFIKVALTRIDDIDNEVQKLKFQNDSIRHLVEYSDHCPEEIGKSSSMFSQNVSLKTEDHKHTLVKSTLNSKMSEESSLILITNDHKDQHKRRNKQSIEEAELGGKIDLKNNINLDKSIVSGKHVPVTVFSYDLDENRKGNDVSSHSMNKMKTQGIQVGMPYHMSSDICDSEENDYPTKFDFRAKSGEKYIVDYFESENIRKIFVTIKLKKPYETSSVDQSFNAVKCKKPKSSDIHHVDDKNKEHTVQTDVRVRKEHDLVTMKDADVLDGDICSLKISDSSEMDSEISGKSLSNLYCNQCYKTFSDKFENYDHICSGKRIKGYICEFCEKVFETSRAVSEHKRLHEMP